MSEIGIINPKLVDKNNHPFRPRQIVHTRSAYLRALSKVPKIVVISKTRVVESPIEGKFLPQVEISGFPDKWFYAGLFTSDISFTNLF